MRSLPDPEQRYAAASLDAAPTSRAHRPAREPALDSKRDRFGRGKSRKRVGLGWHMTLATGSQLLRHLPRGGLTGADLQEVDDEVVAALALPKLQPMFTTGVSPKLVDVGTNSPHCEQRSNRKRTRLGS